MKTRTALESMVQWSIKRLGTPGLQTSLPRRMVAKPSVEIPESIADKRIRSLVASVRYPISAYRDTDANHLWQAYESTIEKFSNVRQLDSWTGNVGLYLCEQLKVPEKTASYLFGEGDGTTGEQLEILAVMVARIANELFGCPYSTEPGGFAAKIGKNPAFGVMNGRIVSRFHADIQVQLARPMLAIENTPVTKIDVGAPAILNLYNRAEQVGDEAVVYFLDSAVWLSQHRASTLHKILYDYVQMQLALSTGRADEVAKVVKDKVKYKRSTKIPLTPSVYSQGKYIIDHAEEPKWALYALLVPHVVSSQEYLKKFANPYDKSRASTKMLEKMHLALDKLYGIFR
jgi:hypothetical protein